MKKCFAQDCKSMRSGKDLFCSKHSIYVYNLTGVKFYQKKEKPKKERGK
jgi:hypothetical protein